MYSSSHGISRPAWSRHQERISNGRQFLRAPLILKGVSNDIEVRCGGYDQSECFTSTMGCGRPPREKEKCRRRLRSPATGRFTPTLSLLWRSGGRAAWWFAGQKARVGHLLVLSTETGHGADWDPATSRPWAGQTKKAGLDEIQVRVRANTSQTGPRSIKLPVIPQKSVGVGPSTRPARFDVPTLAPVVHSNWPWTTFTTRSAKIPSSCRAATENKGPGSGPSKVILVSGRIGVG